MGTFTVRLDNLRLFAHHGVFPHEQNDGNEFIVNLSVEYSPIQEFSSSEDELDNTVSYVRLYDIVREEMRRPRKLLETVAKEIVTHIKHEFPYVERVECHIAKSIPPISGFIGSASVSYKI